MQLIPLVEYEPEFLSYTEGQELAKFLRDNVAWRSESMNFGGRSVPFPRLTAWYGDDDTEYTYSGVTYTPTPWNEPLAAVCLKLSAAYGTKHNSVLLNYYRKGEDSIGWHSDDETQISQAAPISSITLGVERTFIMRDKHSHAEKLRIKLEHGSLVTMLAGAQDMYQHSIPKEPLIKGQRINLTFRTVIPTAVEKMLWE